MRTEIIGFSEAQETVLGAATYLGERIRGADGHAEAIKELVPVYLARGEVDIAAELANSVDDPFTRDRLLSDVAEKCAEIGDNDYAEQLAEAVEDTGLRSAAFERLAIAQAANRNFDLADKHSSQLEHRDDVFARIAVLRAADGDLSAAENVAGQIGYPHAKVTAYDGIAALLVSKKEMPGAQSYFEKAYEECANIEFAEEKVRALSQVAGGFMEAGRSDRAIRVFSEASEACDRIDGLLAQNLLAAISVGLLRAGSLELADLTLDKITNKSIIASTLSMFSEYFFDKGEPDEAKSALDEAHEIVSSEKDSEIYDSKARFAILGNIARRYALFGDPERAIAVAKENPSESDRFGALGETAKWCAINGRGELAEQAIKAITDVPAQASALVSVADIYQNSDEVDEAKRLLNRAVDSTSSILQLASKAVIADKVAIRFDVLGEKDRARELLSGNLVTASNIKDESHQVATLINTGQVFEKLGLSLNDEDRSVLNSLLRRAGW